MDGLLMENPSKMDDLGAPLFSETPILVLPPLQWPRHSVYPHTKNRDFSTSRDRSPGCLLCHDNDGNVDVFGFSGTGPLDG